MKKQSYLIKTTISEIAEDLDELSLYDPLLFSTLDPEELKEFNLEPYEFYVIEKVHFNFQQPDDYSILIRHMNGSHVEIKSIDIISNGEVDNYDERQYGISEFLKEYYEKHMDKNSTNTIYYYCD